MNIPANYFYDKQIRRYLLQFVRIFGAFEYEVRDANNDPEFRRVPSHYAVRDRMIGHIIRNLSENVILTTPFITSWISDIQVSAERRQHQSHVSAVSVTERKLVDGEYTDEPGNEYTVQRYMPVPYDMTMQVDIWTSNEHQKHQLLEQMMVLFNPDLYIQSSENPIDWSSITRVELTNMSWSSRTVPVGTDSDIDISTLTFNVPIWINPPAKVQNQTLIKRIIETITPVSQIDDC